METQSNAKKIMYLVLMILFVSSVNGVNTIDLNEPVIENQSINNYNWLVEKANNYDIIQYIGKHYNLISVEVEDYKVVLDFENNQLNEIRDFNNESVDLELHFTRDDIIYLMDNWQKMTDFDKIKFLLRSDMKIADIITFSAIAMSMR